MSKEASSEGAEAEASEDVKPAEPAENVSPESSEDLKSNASSDSSDDPYSSKLRSGRNPRPSVSRGKSAFRTKRPPLKRKRPLPSASKSHKKQKGEWRDDKHDESESEESEKPVEAEEFESVPVIAQRFLYSPGFPWPDLSGFVQQLVEIRVAKEFLSFGNKEVAAGRIWGTDVYTSDSDIVAIVHHSGLIDISRPIPSQYEGVSVYTRITKGRTNYISTLKNRIRSKRCVNYEGHSLKPDRVVFLTNLGSSEELRDMAARMPSDFQKQRLKPVLNMKKRNLVPGAFLVGNLSAEQWECYSLEEFGDKTEAKSAVLRLKTEVLYIETETERYELAKNEESASHKSAEKYRWSIVKQPLLTKDSRFMNCSKVPLDTGYLKPLHKCDHHTAIDWRDILWGSTSIEIKNSTYGPLKCFKFYSTHS